VKSHFVCCVLYFIIGFIPVGGYQREKKSAIKQFVTKGKAGVYTGEENC
jgi:hypothetical protein